MRKVGEYDENYVTSRSPLRLWLTVLAAVAVMALSVGGLAFCAGWIGTGAKVVSAGNVKEQWRFAYSYQETLRGIAGNWCTAKRDELAEIDPSARSQIRVQRTAHENLYRTRAAEFDAQLEDAFRAKLVKPPDVDAKAPTLDEQLERVGCEHRSTTPAPTPTG